MILTVEFKTQLDHKVIIDQRHTDVDLEGRWYELIFSFSSKNIERAVNLVTVDNGPV